MMFVCGLLITIITQCSDIGSIYIYIYVLCCYLLLCSYATDLVVCSALGVDMYDCVYPTRTAVSAAYMNMSIYMHINASDIMHINAEFLLGGEGQTLIIFYPSPP